MTDREKQIEEMAMSIAECNGTTCENCALKCSKYIICEILHDKGYRKMDEITLKLDLGDRSAEEIQQIAEMFNKAVENEQTLVAVPSDKENLKTIAEDLYPLTIIRDRYTGVYSGASFTAWNLDYDEIPYEVSGDDISCHQFWSGLDTAIYVVGKGATVEEAYCDLLQKMGEQNK